MEVVKTVHEDGEILYKQFSHEYNGKTSRLQATNALTFTLDHDLKIKANTLD